MGACFSNTSTQAHQNTVQLKSNPISSLPESENGEQPVKNNRNKNEEIYNYTTSEDSGYTKSATPTGDASSTEKFEASVKRIIAVNRIQRITRRNQAFKAAQREHQWKIFADLDTKDETEMLNLAVFMQTLIDTVPRSTGKIEREKESLKDKITDDNCIETGKVDDRGRRELEEDTDNEIFINLSDVEYDQSKFHHDDSTLQYEISNMNLDDSCVSAIIEVYRKGGRLSRNSIVKVLRKVYKKFLTMKNTTYIDMSERCKVTVIGDLHGQLPDLLYIIDQVGLPSAENKFVFNGDFVDRGDKGVEVMSLLFVLVAAYGSDIVCLNRGNHEDLPVCRVYGFETECKEKYDELIFEMFAEVFNYLPLFAIVQESVFVVHGGLFHNSDVTMQDLEDIERSDYFVKPPVPYPDILAGLNSGERRKEYLKQLMRDALWSDPGEESGCCPNPRGAGVTFGPDVTEYFMRKHGFSMIVRSHECVLQGYALPFQEMNTYKYNGDGSSKIDVYDPSGGLPFLCTLFSASNYIGGNNEGAILQFATHPYTESRSVGEDSPLHYSVMRYKTSQTNINMKDSNVNSLKDIIIKKKSALASAFEAVDVANTGVISRVEWAEIMQRVMGMRIRWLSLIQSLAPEESLLPNAVKYHAFLSSFSLSISGRPESATALLDEMYGIRRQLESVFYFFDTNGDGVISREEFHTGCAKLNEMLHPDCQLTNIDRTLDVMDFDGSGTIDINEFFETFRILDAKDGQVDGVLSLAKDSGLKHQKKSPKSK